MKNIIIFLISVLMVCNICITNADSWGNTGWSSGNNKEYIRYLPFTNTLNDSLGVIWFNTSDSNFYYVDKAGVHIIGSGSGIKADSAIYADSAFHLFADSNYVVADLIVDTLDADSINTRIIATDTLIIENIPLYIKSGNLWITTLTLSTLLGVNSYFNTYKNKTTEPFVLDFGYNANDSVPFVMKGFNADTVINIDSFNNMRVWNNVIVDDTLTIGDNKVYDKGTSTYTEYFEAYSGQVSNVYAVKVSNISTYPLLLVCGKSFNDSILALLTGAGGDTVVDVDSLNNVRVWNNMTVDDTLTIGDNIMYDNGTFIVIDYPYASTYSGVNIGVSGYIYTKDYRNYNGTPLLLSCGGGYNDSIIALLTGAGGDTVIDVDSLNNVRIRNNMIVDDSLTIGNKKMYDDGTNIYVSNFKSNVLRTSARHEIVSLRNWTQLPLKIDLGYNYNDSIIGYIVGANGDTIITADSLGNLLAYCNLKVKDTLIYYNSNQILFSVIIQDSILTITQDAWTSFKFAKQKLNTDTDYFLFAPANDSTKVIIKKAGYYRFEAKYAYDNNSGASVTDLLVAGRLTRNSVELLCSQILRQCEMKNATSRVLATSGFFNASVNDTIRFEYYSSDPNIDFHTNSVFDSLFAVGMSLEYMK